MDENEAIKKNEARSVATAFMNADTCIFKGIASPRKESFHYRADLGRCCHESRCAGCWLAFLWWVTLDYTRTTHRFRNSPVQSQLLNSLCAARKSCFHVCFMFLTASPKLWNVNLWNSMELLGEVPKCALLHSVLKPLFCLRARSQAVLHTLWAPPSAQSVSGKWITHAISLFCLSKVWKSHTCCNYGA